MKNITNGMFECEVIFNGFNGSIITYPAEEHIVDVIHEAFDVGLVSLDELEDLDNITLTNGGQ